MSEMKCDKIRFFQITAVNDVLYGLDQNGQVWAGVFRDEGVAWVRIEMPDAKAPLVEPMIKKDSA